MNNSPQFRIFSCDGGGFRGYLTSQILESIEEELNRSLPRNRGEYRLKLGDYFDMYAGTSTGALIACGLAFGMSAHEIRGIYEDLGKSIFPNIDKKKELRYRAGLLLGTLFHRRPSRITSVDRFKFSQALFDGTELKKAVEGIFQDKCFGQISKSNKRILVTAYDCWNSLPVVFDSHNEQHRSLKVVDILLASSAYPGGFPSHSILGEGIHDKTAEPGHSLPSDGTKQLPLVDGGLIANNPSLLALSKYFETQKRDRTIPDSAIVASFGTGKLVLQFDNQDTREMGQLDWTFPCGNPLLEVVYGGYSRMIDTISASLVKNFASDDDNEDNYFRFQPYIVSESGQASYPSPDSVLIKPEQRQQFEKATFQYSSKAVLEDIAQAYLQDKELGFCGSSNLHLQVSQRIKKLVRCLWESESDTSQDNFPDVA
ncbi:MAG TPA: patatin-like phospholipase family protein [Allocoleopsis sp.]